MTIIDVKIHMPIGEGKQISLPTPGRTTIKFHVQVSAVICSKCKTEVLLDPRMSNSHKLANYN